MTHLKKSPDQTNSGMDIPDAAIERIARAMLPMIQRYYESDDGNGSSSQTTIRNALPSSSDSS